MHAPFASFVINLVEMGFIFRTVYKKAIFSPKHYIITVFPFQSLGMI